MDANRKRAPRWRAIRTGVIALVLALASMASAKHAFARLTPAEYAAVGVTVPQGAALPAGVMVQDESGRSQRLGALITRPTVLVLADYTCRTLCGPTLAFVAAALEKSGLTAGAQFSLLVIGLNPQNGAADAAAMRRRYLDGAALNAAASVVTVDEAGVQTIARALGYRYRYDPESSQYVHPAAAFVLAADGRVVRVLTGLGLSGDDMRLALIEAAEGKIGTLGDKVRLLCSAFDPVRGAYNVAVSRILAAAGFVTVVLMAVGISFLALTGRRTA